VISVLVLELDDADTQLETGTEPFYHRPR